MKNTIAIENAINCSNLGIDYDAFKTAEELIDYLENEYKTESGEQLTITGEMRKKMRKIFSEHPTAAAGRLSRQKG